MNAPSPLQALLVDDDPSVRKLCRRALESEGARVSEAADWDQARLRLAQGPWDLVLCDVILPGGASGLDLALDARARWPRAAVAVMTGAPSLEAAMGSVRAEACEFLSKPFLPSRIKELARRAAAARSAPDRVEASLREELAAAYARVEEAEAAREALLARVSHELRTPLTVARLAAQLGGEPGGLAATKLEESLAALQERVEDLLAFARPAQAGPRAACDMAALAGRALRRVGALARSRRSRLILTAGAGLPRPAVDAAALEDAVARLLVNALRFGPAGAPVELVLSDQDGGVRFSVRDRGEGPPAELARPWDGFYQAASHMTRTVGGLGLGLALVRRCAEAHGGGAAARRLPEGGGEFSLWIPG